MRFKTSKLLTLAVLSALPSLAAPAPNPRQAIDKEVEALLKDKANYRTVVEHLEKRLLDEDVRTNASLRIFVDQRILSYCKTPSWIKLGLWDKAWSDRHIPVVCAREIAAADCPNGDKLEFLRILARHQAGAEQYGAARQTAEQALKLPDLKPHEAFKAHCLLADVWKWSDDYANARDAFREAARYDAVGAAKELASLAYETGHADDVVAAWQGIADPYPRLAWSFDHDREQVLEDAYRYVEDQSQPEKKRREILIRYFGPEKTDLAARARKLAREFDYTGFHDWVLNKRLNDVYRYGDWAFFVELAETFPTLAWFKDSAHVRGLLFARIASGRAMEVPVLVDDYLAQDAAKEKGGMNPEERLRFEMLKALAEGKDLKAFLDARPDLDRKQYARMLQVAAQWMLNLQRNEVCERYVAAYKQLFKALPERRQAVRFFNRPIASIDAWRAVTDELETSYVDVKMCGALDQLVTDVATGRKEVEKTELDSKDARLSVQTFCDVEGLKIALRVVDPNARAVESGFAGGIGTECYFAPGRGEPYVCFGSTPQEGLGFVFHTTYSHANHERLEFDDLKSPNAIRQETAFSDDDYVLMLTFPWHAFYQKLPVAGTEWRFECLADGYSWGGSQGIHEASSWGSLVFDLKPAEIAAIRRKLVYDTYKTWNAKSHEKLPLFDRWADPVVGDPSFYEAVLKPLEAKLKAKSAKVKPEMSDAEVNDVYENGAKIWMGLDHEIDALRQRWLLDRFVQSCRPKN